MFIITAKMSKAKAVIFVLLLAVVLCCIVLCAGSKSADAGAFETVVKNNEQRVSFLNSLGWEVEAEPLDEQSVIIPLTFSEVYAEYNELQMSQGFDLSEFCGCEATRYTYAVTNYPEASGSVVADMIVYRNRIIAGDIQSTSLGGFMHGFEFPDTK